MKKAVLVISFLFILTGMTSMLLAETHPDYKEAMKYFYKKDYAKAAELLEAYIDLRPEAPAYYRLGYALYELGRFAEAEEYFREAYLIDPEYTPELSPEIRASLKRQQVSVQPAGEQAPAITESVPSAAPRQQPVLSNQKKAFEIIADEIQQEAKGALERVQPGQTPESISPEQPEAPTAQTTPPSIPGADQLPPELRKAFEETMKQMPVQPGEGMPQMDMETFEGPLPVPTGLFAILATVGIIFQLAGIALYIFYCLCYYLIGRKLEVRHSWMAFVPFLQNFWPLIGAAGQSLKWGLLYLLGLPLIGGLMGLFFAMISPFAAMVVMGIIGIVVLVVYAYLWMLTTENLGKNRWLGLLMFVPIINLVWIAVLAFSKAESESDAFEAARMA